MKVLISILTIVFITASCNTRNDKTIYANNKFDILPLPNDSNTIYFKLKPNWTDSTQDAFDTSINLGYSQMLFALREPVIKDYKGDKEIYRFIWLRTFNHPVAIRLEKQRNIIKVFSKVTNGAAGYRTGKIIVDTNFNQSQNQIDTINLKLDNANFWTLSTESKEPTGTDGSQWIIEVFKNGKYHVVERWTPTKGTPFQEIGEYLISISQIKNETNGEDDY